MGVHRCEGSFVAEQLFDELVPLEVGVDPGIRFSSLMVFGDLVTKLPKVSLKASFFLGKNSRRFSLPLSRS